MRRGFPFIILLLALVCQFGEAAPLRVLIDPGHGGRDSGATSNGLKESGLVLKIAKRLGRQLAQDPRFEAQLSRKTEVFSPLSRRVSEAHKMGADVLLSIHANSSPDKKAKGLEVYFQNQLPPEEENLFLASLEGHHNGHMAAGDRSPVVPHPRSRQFSGVKDEVKNIIYDLYRNQKVSRSGDLSKSIVRSWKGYKKRPKNTIRQAPFYVISRSEIPAVLVEIGFVSNSREAKKLKSSQYQQLVADSLYKGLIDYKESIDNR